MAALQLAALVGILILPALCLSQAQSFSTTTVSQPVARPRILSSKPWLVAIGESVIFNCSFDDAVVKSYSWYLNGRLLDGTSYSYQVAHDAPARDLNYGCSLTNDLGVWASQPVTLTVVNEDSISRQSSPLSLRLKLAWQSEFNDSKSAAYFAFNVYIVTMIKEISRPYVTSIENSTVTHIKRSVPPDDFINVELQIIERYIGKYEDHINPFFNNSWTKESIKSYQLNQPNIVLDGIFFQGTGNENYTVEGEAGKIICRFTIAYKKRPPLRVVWLANGAVISPGETTTVSQQSYKINVGPGTMGIFHFENTLKIAAFSSKNIGRYSCRIKPYDEMHAELPFDVGMMDKTQSIDVQFSIHLTTKPDTTTQSIDVESSTHLTTKPDTTTQSIDVESSTHLTTKPDTTTQSIDVESSTHLTTKPDTTTQSIDVESSTHLTTKPDVCEPKIVQQSKSFQKTKNMTCFGSDVSLSIVDDTENKSSPTPPTNTFVMPDDSLWIKCTGLALNGDSGRCNDYLISNDTVFCPEDTDHRGLHWPESVAGHTYLTQCPSGYSGNITRRCLQEGIWGDSDSIGCRNKRLEAMRVEITAMNNNGTQPTPRQITNMSMSLSKNIARPESVMAGDIMSAASILDQVGQAVTSDGDSLRQGLMDSSALGNFADAADVILSSNNSEWTSVLRNSSSGQGDPNACYKLVVGMDRIVAASLFDVSSSTLISKDNLAIQRGKIESDDVQFPNDSEGQASKYRDWVTESETSVQLSARNFPSRPNAVQFGVLLFNRIGTKMVINPNEQNKHQYSKVLYNKQIASDVISFTVSRKMTNLSVPLKLTFGIPKTNLTDPTCGFIDTTQGSPGVWSTRGCETKRAEGREDLVQCQCNHLTNFAILMSPSGTVSGDDHEILSVVTCIGCAISIFCLVLTVIMHAVTWKHVNEVRTVLHVHLSVVLTLAYIVFLAGISQTHSEKLCKVVAVILHFLFLSVFCIMLSEGIQIYLSISIVFSRQSHLWKLLCIAYVVPLLIVSLTVAITRTDGYNTTDFCWLDVDNGSVWAFIGPALCIILINLNIMAATVRKMLKTQAMQTKTQIEKIKSAVKAVCVLSPIFGITWLFGVFAINNSLVVFQYLFAIFNTLQGLFVFMFHCLFCKSIRDGLQHIHRRYHARSTMKSSVKNLYSVSTNRGSSSNSRKESNASGSGSQGKDAPSRSNSQSAIQLDFNGHSKVRSFKYGFPSVEYRHAAGVLNPAFK